MDTGNKIKTGFTLVEILVVFLIFSIMLTVITSVFISGIKIQAKSIAQGQMLDQLNYAIEYMGRSIRMAKKANSTSCIRNGGNYDLVNSSSSIKFLNTDGNNEKCITFSLENDRIYKDTKNDIKLPLTSDDIKVTKLLFNVSDAANTQPKVTILIEAEPKTGDPLKKIKIQTTISQRDLNK